MCDAVAVDTQRRGQAAHASRDRQKESPTPCPARMNPPGEGGCPHRVFQLPHVRAGYLYDPKSRDPKVLTSVHREKPAQGMKLAFDYRRDVRAKPVLTCADLQRKIDGARQRDEPEWRNGRRDGLKNRCLRACGFKSHLRYQSLQQHADRAGRNAPCPCSVCCTW